MRVVDHGHTAKWMDGIVVIMALGMMGRGGEKDKLVGLLVIHYK